jgi:hypothetical protein
VVDGKDCADDEGLELIIDIDARVGPGRAALRR